MVSSDARCLFRNYFGVGIFHRSRDQPDALRDGLVFRDTHAAFIRDFRPSRSQLGADFLAINLPDSPSQRKRRKPVLVTFQQIVHFLLQFAKALFDISPKLRQIGNNVDILVCEKDVERGYIQPG